MSETCGACGRELRDHVGGLDCFVLSGRHAASTPILAEAAAHDPDEPLFRTPKRDHCMPTTKDGPPMSDQLKPIPAPADHRRMPRLRTSTWIYLALVVLAIAAEVMYAVNDDTDLQGHALGWLVVLTVVFAFYRGITRRRSTR